MSRQRPKTGGRPTGRKGRAPGPANENIPESAASLEKERVDDDAVSHAVNIEDGPAASGTRSVLPGPPIPPERQAEMRRHPQRPASDAGRNENESQKGDQSMVDPNKIREHMEVVGSDGEHVGTVDRCEGAERIKLTKSDPAAGGQHHYIPMDWVNSVDQRVHLAHPGADARRNWM